MSYSFAPMSDEELNSYDLIPEGIYNFEVLKATRKISKTGNPMAELQLAVWDNDNKLHTIFDYLVFSTVKLNIKKVSHFSRATGLHEEYKKGCLPEELERYSGKVEIGIQEEIAKPSGGFYPKKNIVVDYISDNVGESKPKSAPVNDFVDSELPF